MRKRKLYKLNGDWLTVYEIAKRVGISRHTLHKRLTRGMSLADAISKPITAPRLRNPKGSTPKLHEFRGQMLSVKEIAAILGMSRFAVQCRCLGNRILDGDELASDRRRYREPHDHERLITFAGETKNVSDWARTIGCNRTTLSRRLSSGWPKALAFAAPSRRTLADTITFQGRTMPVAAWAKEIGIRRTTLVQRLNYGWSVERALTEPLNKNKSNRGHSKTSKPHLGTGPGSTEADFQCKNATG